MVRVLCNIYIYINIYHKSDKMVIKSFNLTFETKREIYIDLGNSHGCSENVALSDASADSCRCIQH